MCWHFLADLFEASLDLHQGLAGSATTRVNLQGFLDIFQAGARFGQVSQDQPGLFQSRVNFDCAVGPRSSRLFIPMAQFFHGDSDGIIGNL